MHLKQTELRQPEGCKSGTKVISSSGDSAVFLVGKPGKGSPTQRLGVMLNAFSTAYQKQNILLS